MLRTWLSPVVAGPKIDNDCWSLEDARLSSLLTDMLAAEVKPEEEIRNLQTAFEDQMCGECGIVTPSETGCEILF